MKTLSIKKTIEKKDRKRQKGYTLLEYAAGATVLMALLYGGLNAMGNGIQDLMAGVGTWAAQQDASLPINPNSN